MHACKGLPGIGSPDKTLSTDSEYVPAVRARKATVRHPSALTLTAADTGPGPEPDVATMAGDRPSVTRLPNLSQRPHAAQLACFVEPTAFCQSGDHSMNDQSELSRTKAAGSQHVHPGDQSADRGGYGDARVGENHADTAGLSGGPAAPQVGGVQRALRRHGRCRDAGAPLPYGAARRVFDRRNELEGAGLRQSSELASGSCMS